MKPRISSRDLELLSRYLDEQLEPGELKRLEARLVEDSALQAVLADLRKTRLLLRSMPRLRVPRNFTISQSRSPARATRRWGPAMGFVSALASLVLVLVLAGDLFGLFLPPKTARLALPAAPQVKSFQNFATGVAAEPTQTASAANSPAATLAVSLDRSESPAPTGTPEPLSAMAEAQPTQPGLVPPTQGQSLAASSPISGTVTLATTEALVMKALPTEQVTQTMGQSVPAPANIVPQTQEKLEDTPTVGPGLATGELATPEGLDQSLRSAQNESSSTGARGTTPVTRWILWILEVALALVAVGAGITAWVLRRKQGR